MLTLFLFIPRYAIDWTEFFVNLYRRVKDYQYESNPTYLPAPSFQLDEVIIFHVGF